MKELILVKDEKSHSDYSPSGSHRWMNCSQSVQLIRKCPKPKDSVHALEGVTAHAMAEFCLKNEVNPKRVKISKKSDPQMKAFVNDEMRKHVETYINYVNSFYEPGDEVLIEQSFDLRFITGNLIEKFKGSTDATIIKAWDCIHVFDLKYGKGKKVEVVNNSQQILYALGAAERAGWDFNEVHIHICQPRVKNGFNVFTMSRDELKGWEALFHSAIVKAEHKNAKTTPGDWCTFCPAMTICPSKRKQVEDQFEEVEEKALVIKQPAKITAGQISEILDKQAAVEEFFKAVYAEAHRRLEAGQEIPGYKLVSKRAERVWTNVAKVTNEAKKKFKMKAFTEPKLLSPAQLEKIAGKDWVNKRVAKISSGTKVAKEGDERNEERPRIEQQFEDVSAYEW